jgi:type VI secretion system protein ImpK
MMTKQRRPTARRRKETSFPDLSLLDAVISPGVNVQRSISEAIRPCLVEVACLGLRERKPPVDVAYAHARDLLNSTKSRLEALSLPREDVRDIFYALVAYTDEVMQLEPGPLKEFWQAHLLQLEYFDETRAGEGFFERLEKRKAEHSLPVLRVYHLCLLFGFHGIYAHHGELERENLIDSLRVILGDKQASARPTPLSPRGERPDEPGASRERNVLLQWFAGACAALAVIWYVGIVFAVDAQERVLAETLARAVEDLKLGTTAASP